MATPARALGSEADWPRNLRVSLPRPLTGALVCTALMTVVTWAVLAAGWVNGAGATFVVAVAATLEAALLARAHVSRLFMALLTPVLALAAIVPATLGAMPFDGNGSFGHVAGRYLGALAGGLAASTDWPFTVGLCAVLWLCGYWLGWMALREHHGVLAVLPLFAVLATNVLNAHNADAIALPEAVAVGLALLVVAGAHLDALQSRWSTMRVGSLPGMRSRFAASAWVVAFLLTVAALILPPLTSTDISARFFPGNGPEGSDIGGQAGTRNPSAPATIQFSSSTQPGGPLVSQAQPVLTYTVDTTSSVYLGVIVDSMFSGGNWNPGQPGTTSANNVAFTGLQFRAGRLPRDRSLGDGGVGAAQTTVTATIVMQPGATGNGAYGPFVGEPDTSNIGGVAYGEIAGGNGASLLTVDQVRLTQRITASTQIKTTGTLSSASEEQLRSAGVNYPGFLQPYTQLSDDATQGLGVVRALAQQWTAGTTNPYDAALQIQGHLRNPALFTYTLTPPATPANEWPIVYFLVTSHRGYCQYFASAMGTMLRSLGIPTRLVNGYGPGTTQAQSGRPGQRQQLVSTSDAHTWVEAYFPGYGWIPFEPTPPSSDGNYVPFTRGTPPPPPPATNGGSDPLTFPGLADPAGQAAQTGGQGGAAQRPIALFVLAGAAAALLLLALAILTWLALPRSLHGAWRRVEALGAFMGMQRRPGETHREYARRLTTARIRLRLPAEVNHIATLCGHAEFSPAGNRQSEAARLLHDWRQVLRVVPRITWARWRHRGAVA
jgi:hypothetical protein